MAGLLWLGALPTACSPATLTATDPAGTKVPTLSKHALTFGKSEHICQLTGDTDWETRAPTSTLTQSFGLSGTDLGYPVEHDGGLALLFGDSRPNPSSHANEAGPPDDAVGWITSPLPPTRAVCTNLVINHGPSSFLPARIESAPPIKQGLFNVPSGGVSKDGFLYAFFWTDHCSKREECPQSETLNEIGRGVLARSEDRGRTFGHVVPMPRAFVYSTAADSIDAAMPPAQKLGVYVIGVPQYRASIPNLAYAPRGKLDRPEEWLYLAGRKPNNDPMWVSSEVWERGFGSTARQQELFAAEGNDRCVGELVHMESSAARLATPLQLRSGTAGSAYHCACRRSALGTLVRRRGPPRPHRRPVRMQAAYGP